MNARFTLMSRLGLAEPLVRLARSVESSNRRAASKQMMSNRDLVARPSSSSAPLSRRLQFPLLPRRRRRTATST
jgi:hypothetical protein